MVSPFVPKAGLSEMTLDTEFLNTPPIPGMSRMHGDLDLVGMTIPTSTNKNTRPVLPVRGFTEPIMLVFLAKIVGGN